LEFVLERLQNDKEALNSSEVIKYQQTIKEQATAIHSLQKETQNYRVRK
jgi:hypothetical protein